MASKNIFNSFTRILRKTNNLNNFSRTLCAYQLSAIKHQIFTQAPVALFKPYTQPRVVQWIQAVKYYSSDADPDVSKRVLECISQFDKLGAKAEELTLESRFKDDLSMDSLDHVEMIMSIEDEFGVEIPDDELEKLTTPANIVAYLLNKANLPAA